MESSRKPAPAELAGAVRDLLRAHVFPAARLCLGFSGGLDSSVLLHVLHGLRPQLDIRLSVIHVHHGLSANADAWADFCRHACDRLDLPLTVRRVRVAAAGQGIEAAARAARYRAYAQQPADFMVLAHQRDDQAETLLLRLLRGAGAQGLAAMAEVRGMEVQGMRLLRPLLAWSREDLRAYADSHGIVWIDDDSNADPALARNWLRHAVLPLLAERYPACRRVLARSAGQLAEAVALLDELARQDSARAVDEAGLSLPALRSLSPPRAKNLLRHWLHATTGTRPSQARLEDMLAQLLTAGRDRHPEFSLGGLALRRHGERLVVARVQAAPPPGDWRWQGEADLRLGEHGRLAFARAEGRGLAASRLPPGGAQVAWRTGGEVLRPDCRRPRRSLKNLLREHAVPVEARKRLPLLLVDDRVVWAAGIGVDCDFQAGPGEPGWVIDWSPSG